VALLAAGLALVGGRLVTKAALSAGVGRSLVAGLFGAAVTVAVLVLVVAVADRSDARALLSRLRGADQ
jgi:hypothetical protein